MKNGVVMNFDKQLVIESFNRIEPNLDNFTRAFFDNLFLIDPQIQKLFRHTNFDELRPKFVRALTIAVHNLSNPEYLKYYLQGVGQQQIKYEITETYFPSFEEALIQTLMLFHINSWTPQLENAWREFFYFVGEHISDGMVDATLKREFEDFLDEKERSDFFKKAA